MSCLIQGRWSTELFERVFICLFGTLLQSMRLRNSVVESFVKKISVLTVPCISTVYKVVEKLRRQDSVL